MEWFVLSSEDIVVFMEMEMLPPRPPWWMAAWPVLNHYGPGRGYLAAFEPRNWPTDRSHFSLYEVIFEELPSWSFKSAPTFLMSFGAVALDAEDLWVGMRSFRRKRDCRLACDSFGPHGSGWGVGGGGGRIMNTFSDRCDFGYIYTMKRNISSRHEINNCTLLPAAY